MREYSNLLQGYVVRVTRGKIKINASLTGICNSLGVPPNKAVTAFNEVLPSVPLIQKKFYVRLFMEGGELKAQLLDVTDTEKVRQMLLSEPDKQKLQILLEDYAKATVNKTAAFTVSKRLNELKGILRSFKVK